MPTTTTANLKSTRRQVHAPTAKAAPNLKVALVSPDDLADHLATSLAISNAKGKRKATSSATSADPEECRLSAMRAVNTGLQSLSTVIQSGWKRSAEVAESSSNKKNSALASIRASSTTISTSLQKLRDLRPGDIDVERAALSYVGKVVSLEMFDMALLELAEMHSHLCALYHPDPPKKPPAKKKTSVPKRLNPADYLYTLSLPFPPSGTPEDPILLNLISTYLLHAITCFSQQFIPTRSATTTTTTITKDAATVDLLSKTLPGTSTLLAWIQLLPTHPAKQKDAPLTSAYTVLVKSTSSPKSNHVPSAIFTIRSYALSCLLYTSPDVVDPNAFWAQVVKFGVDFFDAASSKNASSAAAKILLSTFVGFIDIAEKREDHDKFLAGKKFTVFCEQWMKYARQEEDRTIIDRITTLTQSLTTGIMPPVSENAQDTSHNKGSKSSSNLPALEKATNVADLEEDKMCTIFTLATSLLEQFVTKSETDSKLTECVREAAIILRRQIFHVFPDQTAREERRKTNKAGKAFERLRRIAVKVADAPQAQSSEANDSARLFLVSAIDALENAPATRNDPDLLGQALDTLFVLARVSFVPQDTRRHGSAFDFLARAVKLLGLGNGAHTSEAVETESHANFARCVSGAFYNFAGTLYQEGRSGPAVRFLKEACVLGDWALRIYNKGKVSDAIEEHWGSLEKQLYRRWELLAVCYVKIGDRKLAFDAFIQAVKTFPYLGTDFVAHAGLGGPNIVFNGSKDLKQLGNIVEKLTYMGTCDLFLDPACISLRTTMAEYPPAVIGMLLERQLESLNRSLWKEGVSRIVSTLFLHAREVYVGDKMPIRRARILLGCMDFVYHMGPEKVIHLGCPQEMGDELEKLLTRVDFVQDGTLAKFCRQYRACAHLWLAMHAHRRMGEQQSTLVARHAEDACKDLKEALKAMSEADVPPKAKKANPNRKVAVKTRSGRSAAKGPFNIVGEPVTPKPRKVVDSLNVSPPKMQADVKNLLVIFEDIEKLLALLETTASLLGLLGLTFQRIVVLEIIRQICERHTGTLDNNYLMASAELAHQFMNLGKVRRADTIYSQVLSRTRSVNVSAEVRIYFLLRQAEMLALFDNVPKSSNSYCDALSLSKGLTEDHGTTTSQRVRTRVGHLERAAIAAHAFAEIQRSNNDLVSSLEGLLQSLRLWNRAVDSLARLRPVIQASKPAEVDPFQMTDMKDALPSDKLDTSRQGNSINGKSANPRFTSDNLELRISQGLLNVLFALCEAYITRGSAREAEYFAQQAHEFAMSMNAPAMAARALVWIGEVQLQQGRLQDGYQSLLEATEILKDTPNTDCADARRLHGDYNRRCAQHKDAQCLYEEATRMLEELDGRFVALDSSVCRKTTSLPHRTEPVTELLAPSLLATVLHQHIWLLRDDNGARVKALLDRLLSLPPSAQTKAEENALMAKLTLHKVFARFRADMFLNSLAESPITLPMGISSDKLLSSAPSTREILGSLDNAEKLFWADLNSVRGRVPHVRDAAVSLALIRALQTSLGKSEKDSTVLTLNLLDVSTAITLRREMLETIRNRFQDIRTFDDMQWPLISTNGTILPRPKNATFARLDDFLDSDEEFESTEEEKGLREYWESIRTRYSLQTLDAAHLSVSSVDKLPKNWTVVSICVTEDKSTMFVTRQRASTEPLIFCLPLKGRRETEGDEHLTFEDAMKELRTIVNLSDEGTRQAVNVKGDDMQARAAWWAERNSLDKRMQELLENIEFCWLGAFKTILSQPTHRPADVGSDLRTRLDIVFQNGLRSQEKKQKTRIRLDDNLLECFSSLSPKCRDEELEDLVYFILDLYQFHGVGVAIAEVDIDHVVVDLRIALEEHAEKTKGKAVPEKDSHMFLILDRNVQGIPWESIPILRGRNVSRIPSMDFLVDRLQFAKWQRERNNVRQAGHVTGAMVDDRAVVDPRKTYFVLNPSGDLGRTEGRFVSWLKDMGKVGWEGIVGRPPSEQQFLDALSRKDLVIYFGHGGGEQYVRSHKIRNLQRCAATMLWGCSSGTLREMGDFERIGTPYNYILAGCPCLVANIWDVTDRDIDKFAQTVFEKMNMTVPGVRQWQQERGNDGISVVAAVAQSRESCKLKYLTGAAPVVYGIPFYL